MRVRLGSFVVLIATLIGAAAAKNLPAADTALRPASDRKAAPDFALTDANGSSIALSRYKWRVILLDFWATWCAGCKVEIPWYMEFQKKYAARGLTSIGVALDDEGGRRFDRTCSRTRSTIRS